MNVSEMQISETVIGGAVVIAIEHSRVDARCSARLKSSVRRAVVRAKNGIVLDLAGVGFVDSTGLSAFVGLLKVAARERQPLVICSANEAVKTLFRLTRVDQIVPSYGSPTEAVTALAEMV